MRLFTIDSAYQVELNKEWIMLIPEFADLLKRDKGSKGDYRGEKKLKARKEFTFIYFDLDFTSPIREYPDYERRMEAMQYAGLEEADLDDKVMAAHARYNELLLHNSRSLKTLRAVEYSLDQLDEYFLNLDFSKLDKKGELVNKPEAYLGNLKRLNDAYNALDNFRKRVNDELKGDSGIRGTATLGRKEGKRTEWEEGKKTETPIAQTNFRDIAVLLQTEEGKMLNEDDDEEETE